MRNFHETKRAVRTASSEQVRQPIYRGAVQTWKRYGASLDGLREILSPVLPRADQSTRHEDTNANRHLGGSRIGKAKVTEGVPH